MRFSLHQSRLMVGLSPPTYVVKARLVRALLLFATRLLLPFIIIIITFCVQFLTAGLVVLPLRKLTS